MLIIRSCLLNDLFRQFILVTSFSSTSTRSPDQVHIIRKFFFHSASSGNSSIHGLQYVARNSRPSGHSLQRYHSSLYFHPCLSSKTPAYLQEIRFHWFPALPNFVTLSCLIASLLMYLHFFAGPDESPEELSSEELHAHSPRHSIPSQTECALIFHSFLHILYFPFIHISKLSSIEYHNLAVQKRVLPK